MLQVLTGPEDLVELVGCGRLSCSDPVTSSRGKKLRGPRGDPRIRSVHRNGNTAVEIARPVFAAIVGGFASNHDTFAAIYHQAVAFQVTDWGVSPLGPA